MLYVSIHLQILKKETIGKIDDFLSTNLTANGTRCGEYGCTPTPPYPTPPYPTPYPTPSPTYYPTPNPTYPPPYPPNPYPTPPPNPYPCFPSPLPTTYPTLPSITITTNCDFCDHSLYSRPCVQTAFACGMLCAADSRCTHFTHVANMNGGTCFLKTAPDSGGNWASTIPPPSAYSCGYIPKRSYANILLSICFGYDVSLGNTPYK